MLMKNCPNPRLCTAILKCSFVMGASLYIFKLDLNLTLLQNNLSCNIWIQNTIVFNSYSEDLFCISHKQNSVP